MNHKLHCQVPESHIVLINLFCTPKAAAKIVKENPKVRKYQIEPKFTR